MQSLGHPLLRKEAKVAAKKLKGLSQFKELPVSMQDTILAIVENDEYQEWEID